MEAAADRDARGVANFGDKAGATRVTRGVSAAVGGSAGADAGDEAVQDEEVDAGDVRGTQYDNDNEGVTR